MHCFALLLLGLLALQSEPALGKKASKNRKHSAPGGNLPVGYRGPRKSNSARDRGVDVLPAARAPSSPLLLQGERTNPDDPRYVRLSTCHQLEEHSNAIVLARFVYARSQTSAVQMWEKARTLLESCPAARAIGEPCAAAEEAEAVWRVLAELLEPTHVDVGFNLALSLERFDQYYDATLVWEAVVMANPEAHSRATQECSKVISLIAREMGVPDARSQHPDPAVEQRRRKERDEQGVSSDPNNVVGGLGEMHSEMRHLQDDALAIQEEAKRLMLSDACAGVHGHDHIVACHERAVSLLALLVFAVPNHGAAIGQLAEALTLSGRPSDALQLLNRVEVCASVGVLVERVGESGLRAQADRELFRACRGMFLNDKAVMQAQIYRAEVSDMMRQLCEKVDKPSLAEARTNAELHGRAAGYDRLPEEVFVRSKYGTPKDQASYGDDIKYWQRRVDMHCPPQSENDDFHDNTAGWGAARWNAAPTDSGMHNPERLPQMLRNRGITPASELAVSDSMFWALMGVVPLVAVIAYNYGAKKQKGRRGRR